MAGLMTPKARLYYWRTTSGQEVDFVVEHGRRVIAVEAKMAARVHDRDAEGLRYFIRLHPKTSVGIVAYCGKEIVRLDRAIFAIPWQTLA